jgi:GT2 family glycosyltransferase
MPLPLISVVIATYERPEQLARCLQALAAQDYPTTGFEVVVVDDGGSRPLEDVLQPFRRELNLVLLRQENAGPAAGRNRGAAEARGELLMFTDDDCEPEPGWLSAMAARLRADPELLVGGRTENGLKDNLYSAASQLLVAYLYDYFADRDSLNEFFTTNNMALRRERFQDLGGFDMGFPRSASEDRELCDRWRHAGRKLAYAAEAVVRHYHSLTFSSFWRQHFVYGTGAFYFHKLRGHRSWRGMRFEPPSFYLGMLAYPFRRRCGVRAPLLSVLLAVSQLSHALGYFHERRRNRGVSR